MSGFGQIHPEKSHRNSMASTDVQYRFVELQQVNWSTHAREIMRIEQESYELSRRESAECLARAVLDSRGVAFIACDADEIVGFCFGAPLELFGHVGGVRQDPQWQKHSTLYSIDVTVVGRLRRNGIGRLLKLKQIDTARRRGYLYISGRNRLAWSDDMVALNLGLGARPLRYLQGTYRDGLIPDTCLYYQLDLSLKHR
jgi:predicted GNAT superfamily acetyltransferase